MALIKCPECGKSVSSLAKTCPDCGLPLSDLHNVSAAMPPQTQRVQAPQPHTAQGKVGLNAQRLVCSYCNAPLSSNDIISSGWARCPQCGKDVALQGVNEQFSDAGIIEYIVPFEISEDQFHKRCMQQMMETAPQDFFANVSNIKVTKKYIWVREFGNGVQRQICAMDGYGQTCLRLLNDGLTVVDCAVYESWWLPSKMEPFSTDIVDDAELVAKKWTGAEVKHMYSTAPNSKSQVAKDTYYCVPIMEERFTYNNKEYVIYGLGTTDSLKMVWTEIPTEEFLKSTPKFFDGQPMVTTGIIIVAIIAICIVVALFSNGFWSGLITLIILGVVFAIVGPFVLGIAAVPLLALDAIIKASINKGRKTKFLNRYDAIQSSKQKDAKQLLGLDLTYALPEVKIP